MTRRSSPRSPRAGCSGVLIGFESLDEGVLRAMKKRFNTHRAAVLLPPLANLRRHGIRASTAPSCSGYDGERADAFDQAANSPWNHRFYLAASITSRRFRARLCSSASSARAGLALRALVARRALRLQRHSVSAKDHGSGRYRQGCLRARRRFYTCKASCDAPSTR